MYCRHNDLGLFFWRGRRDKDSSYTLFKWSSINTYIHIRIHARRRLHISSTWHGMAGMARSFFFKRFLFLPTSPRGAWLIGTAADGNRWVIGLTHNRKRENSHRKVSPNLVEKAASTFFATGIKLSSLAPALCSVIPFSCV